MAALISNFLECVVDVNALNPEDFIKNQKFSCDLVFDNVIFKYNMWFHCVWKFFFGSYAPRRYFVEFWECYKDNIETILGNSASLLKSRQFNLASKLLIYYNQHDLDEYLSNVKIKLNDRIFAKEFIVHKLCLRYGRAFELSMLEQNPILLYAKFATLTEPISDANNNPISNHNVEKEGDIETTYYDRVHDNIISDRHFIYKLVNSVIIYVDNIDIDAHILKSLVHVCLDVGGKPIILNSSKDSFEDIETYIFNVEPAYMQYIPTVASHFICISNKRYPDIKPLARDKRNNIYYLRGWCENDIVNNLPTTIKSLYNRCVTSIPIKISGLPLKTYRIMDIISLPSRNTLPECSTHKILIGRSSKAPSMVDITAPTRVEVYTEQNKHTVYSKVVDTYKEIPITRIYEMLSNGAEIIRDDILITSPGFLKTLFSQHMFSRVWKDHLKYTCPYQNSTNPGNNILLYNEFLINYAAKNKKITPACLDKENTVVLIDNRENPCSIMSILIALTNIQEGEWSCKVLTSRKARDYYSDILSCYGVQVIPIAAANTTNFDIDTYNGILKSKATWDIIGGTHALIIQDDGILVKSGVESFLMYDYVGAPWLDVDGNKYIKENINPALVGNGGFSLRNVKKASEIVSKYEKEKYNLFLDNQVEIPEDVYFVQCLVLEDAKLPTTNTASMFSSEQIMNIKSLGFHKPWMYHHRDNIEAFFNAMLLP